MAPSRNDIETTTAAVCPVCHTGFVPVRRQRYCSPACRQAAWRVRAAGAERKAAATAVPTDGGRREHTVYACTDCEQRYLGQQWCDDCARPCIRLGLGGLCTSCEEPITIDELLDRAQDVTVSPKDPG
jgi:hypothetical protein